MKKIALFLLLCCLAAACSKNTEIMKPAVSGDVDLELLIQEDASQLFGIVRRAFVDVPAKQAIAAKGQLEAGAPLAEVLGEDRSQEIERLQVRVLQHLSSLSYAHDQDRVTELLSGVSVGTIIRSRQKSMDTPCFDAWDLRMGTIAATYLVCLGYSKDLITASRCTVMAAIATVSAELAYQDCMDQY